MSTARKIAYLSAAQAFQWLPERAIRRHQLARLRRVLAHCERSVPLYREAFRAAGVRARDLRRLEDLAIFPRVTREQIVDAYPDGVLSRRPREGDVLFRTSATSGLSMRIAYSAAANDFLDAIYGRALFATGYRPWERIAYFWWEEEPKPLRVYERLGLMRKDLLNMSPDPYTQLEQLRGLQPRWIYNFPSVMTMIARIVEEEGVDDLRPRGIICHGELMPKATQREIARVFGCPVFDQYGAQEFNRLGWDCELHDAMHLDADSVVLEVLDGGEPVAPGEEGELVFTGLANPLMPLVRYRIGDTGRLVPGPCPCGRGLPRYEVTEGRADDVLTLPGGRRLGPRVIAPAVERIAGIRQYRVVQTRTDRVEVRVVHEPSAPPGMPAQVERTLRELLGPDVTLHVERVDEIPLNRRGKLRKVVCEVRAA